MKIENEQIEIREELPSLKNFAGGVLFCGATAFFFLVAVTKGNIEDIGYILLWGGALIVTSIITILMVIRHAKGGNLQPDMLLMDERLGYLESAGKKKEVILFDKVTAYRLVNHIIHHRSRPDETLLQLHIYYDKNHSPGRVINLEKYDKPAHTLYALFSERMASHGAEKII